MSVWNQGSSGGVLRRFGGFSFLFATGLLLFVPCIALPAITDSSQGMPLCQATSMCASQSTPWGVVTGLSLFDGMYNVGIFALFAVLFVQWNLGESLSERSRRSCFFLVSSFGSAVAANCVWVLLTPGGYTYGQSGVVYSLLGALFAVVFNRGLPRSGVRQYLKTRHNIVMSGAYLSAIIPVILLIASPVGSLVLGGAGLNQMVHQVTLAAGFFLTVPYYYFGRSSSR
jgi:hypothetical protein